MLKNFSNGPLGPAYKGTSLLWRHVNLEEEQNKNLRSDYGATADGLLTTIGGLERTLNRLGFEFPASDPQFHVELASEIFQNLASQAKGIKRRYEEEGLIPPKAFINSQDLRETIDRANHHGLISDEVHLRQMHQELTNEYLTRAQLGIEGGSKAYQPAAIDRTPTPPPETRDVGRGR